MCTTTKRAGTVHKLNMLAFDIETTGLDVRKHAITVVAFYGIAGNEKVDIVLNFARDGLEVVYMCCVCVCVCVCVTRDDSQPQRTKLLDLMSRAESLCAFNAVRFDIPFIMHFLSVPARTCSEWVAKLYDPFEVNAFDVVCVCVCMCVCVTPTHVSLFLFVCDRSLSCCTTQRCL